eukprot:NODE_123_length_17687_cov_0.732261.p9 type:complete len:259 gc:universal NODE_123_length_17687_cov_0.732261:16604-15828(-)
MDFSDVYQICWGGSLCLMIQNFLLAVMTFDKKRNKIFQLIIAGLLICFGLSTLVLSKSFDDKLENMIVYKNIVWFVLVQTVSWLYVLRIKSLGNYIDEDRYVNYLPCVVALLQIPCIFVNALGLKDIKLLKDRYTYFAIAGSVFSLGITIIEIYMYYILLKKLDFILEYRPRVAKKLKSQLQITCAFMATLEIGLAILRCVYPITFAISPIIYMLRISVLIKFYSDLLANIDSDCIEDLSRRSYISLDSAYLETHGFE